MSERYQVFLTLFCDPESEPLVSLSVYGDKKDQHAVEMTIAGHVLSVHGISPDQLNKLADALYDASRRLEERIADKAVKTT